MERRSAKRTTPRKKYTVDAFEGVEELRDVLSGDDGPPRAHDGADDVLDDSASEASDHAMSDADAEIGDDAASEVSEADLDDADDEVEDDLQKSTRRSGITKRTLPQKSFVTTYDARAAERPDEQLYTRGLPDLVMQNVSKLARRTQLFGHAPEDYEPPYIAWAKWASYPTLPSRVKEVGGHEDAGFESTASHEAWRWYHESGGKEAFASQHTSMLGVDSAAEYMPPSQSSINFLMGPYSKPVLHKLLVGESVALKDAWPETQKAGLHYKTGFVLNLGGRVQSLDWLPGQSGKYQYLAASTRPSEGVNHEPSTAPAFNPQPARKSSIQIWRLEASDEGTIAVQPPPHLCAVLCTNWNIIRSLKWCPLNKSGKSPDLLATMTADGAVRVIEIILPNTDMTGTSYQLIEKVAFESKPPGTVCTCVTWLSPSRIAAGCANGCIAVWDLEQTLNTSAPHRPAIYSSISTSYILSIASCSPSHPNLLITTSMTGHVLLTDLSRPHILSPASTAQSARHRIAQPMLLWNDFAQCAISVDDAFGVKAYPLRRWFATTALCRAKSSATAIAGSPHHPHILIGTASGEVVANNPLNRIIESKAEVWIQTWFAHEWRRPRDGEEQVGGMSKFTEGFKAERLSLGPGDGESAVKDGNFHTIYEAKSAVTALAWCPNKHVSGWAAAGMADGLLRVEDVAV